MEPKRCFLGLFRLTVVLYLSVDLVVSRDNDCKIVHGRRGCISKTLQGVIVSCDGQGSHKIVPKDIPSNTVYLKLENFAFEGLIRSNFTHLPKVECLIINDSGITAVESGTFMDMKKLLELELRKTHLSGNDLQFINDPHLTAKYVTVSDTKNKLSLDFDGTKHLNRIESLRLPANGISKINPSITSNLTHVEELDLSDNGLELLDWPLLSDLRKLNRLYLSGNKLQTLPESAENVLAVVKELKLGNNPFHCSCAIRWLREYYETAVDRILDYDIVECASPFKERTRMMNTSPRQFTCSRPEKPEVIREKLSDTLYGVHCSGFGNPPPNVTLIIPGKNPFIYQAPKDLSQLNVTTPVVVVSTGTVVCKASNSQGDNISEVKLSSFGQEGGGNHGHKSSFNIGFLLATLWLTIIQL